MACALLLPDPFLVHNNDTDHVLIDLPLLLPIISFFFPLHPSASPNRRVLKDTTLVLSQAAFASGLGRYHWPYRFSGMASTSSIYKVAHWTVILCAFLLAFIATTALAIDESQAGIIDW